MNKKSVLLFGKQHIISSFKRKLQDDERQDATHMQFFLVNTNQCECAKHWESDYTGSIQASCSSNTQQVTLYLDTFFLSLDNKRAMWL